MSTATEATIYELHARDEKVAKAIAVLDQRKNKLGWSDDVLLAAVQRFTSKAWNYDRAGRQVRVLRWRTGGDKPEAFPDIA